MTPHPAALEAWNRLNFDPQTPEIVPAETMQVEERPTPMSIIATIPAREIVAAFAIAGAFYFIAAAVSAVVP